MTSYNTALWHVKWVIRLIRRISQDIWAIFCKSAIGQSSLCGYDSMMISHRRDGKDAELSILILLFAETPKSKMK
ncbi:MAG: hypothetical protein E3J94_01700 [Desulfobacteraceae bacterium]|nr:MAG: hypothetical protein E3J94_01700 [Desulfobacteraceae bacterium]